MIYINDKIIVNSWYIQQIEKYDQLIKILTMSVHKIHLTQFINQDQ